MGDSEYSLLSLSSENPHEGSIDGRYYNKRVDISIEKNRRDIAGIAVKFVMSNYLQNSNNYFENMLGETANIRSARIQYYQILIIPDRIPYYNKDGKIKKWEAVDNKNIQKYIALSNDNIDCCMHTPNKTLLFIIHLSEYDAQTREEYKSHYLNHDYRITLSEA